MTVDQVVETLKHKGFNGEILNGSVVEAGLNRRMDRMEVTEIESIFRGLPDYSFRWIDGKVRIYLDL